MNSPHPVPGTVLSMVHHAGGAGPAFSQVFELRGPLSPAQAERVAARIANGTAPSPCS